MIINIYKGYHLHFYKPAKNGNMTCTLCHHYCDIKLDKTGICGINKNIGGKIKCLVYGYPAVINVDPIEKKPFYHFLPNTKTLSIGTVGCNFKCSFCQNHGISQEQTVNTSRYYPPLDIVNLALKNRCDSISYTYNEPTIFYPYIRDIAILAKKYGLKNIFVSNGFESFEVLKDMSYLIDGANIDLKSYDDKYYKQKLGGDLEKLKTNLKLFKKLNIWIEITTLIIPKLNDSDEELGKIAHFISSELGVDTPWHLSAFHPDYKMLNRKNTTIESLQNGYTIGKKYNLSYVYMGNAGLQNNSHCEKCGELFLQRVRYKTTIDNRKFGVLCTKCDTKLKGVFHSLREMSVANSFYSSDKNKIKEQFLYFSNLLEKSDFNKKLDFIPKAIIVPHAGFVYSGFTSSVAYDMIQNIDPKRVLVIGPSHKYSFKDASVALFDSYETPLENIKIDTIYGKKLIEKYDFIHFNQNVHNEHSTETQAPFIKYRFPNATIVEIVYGQIEFLKLSLIINDAIKDDDTFVIISTDLSHFYTKKEALLLDNICLEAVDKLDLNVWNKGCEACGRVGVKAMIDVANKLNLQSRLLDYRTSADITNDETKVVGYMSAILG
jgi:AmmeMemoRadiSam system radical SAM enzyme/AmmeMemoRadiSam system protein B